MAHADPLFPPHAPPYTATVDLADIKLPRNLGARSHSTRSIETFGALTLPLLRERFADATPEGEQPFEVVDGARRISDLRNQDPDGAIEVKILPHEVDPATASAMAVALNYGRAPNPLQEAERFAHLRRQGYDVYEIATMIGVSKSKVKRRMGLIDGLTRPLYDAMHESKISIGVAEKISRMSEPLQLRFEERLAEEGSITNETLSDELRNVRKGMLPQGLLFEQEPGPRVALRRQLAELRSEGLSYAEAREELDRMYQGQEAQND